MPFEVSAVTTLSTTSLAVSPSRAAISRRTFKLQAGIIEVLRNQHVADVVHGRAACAPISLATS